MLVALLVVVALPWLVSSDAGRSWLLSVPRGVFVWIALAAAAIVGLLAGVHLLSSKIETGAAVLVATPFFQALLFVAIDRLFILLAHRTPVPMSQARRGRRPDGRRWWPDVAFWALTTIALVGGAELLCASFGVEFPSRYSGRQ
jgi:hypothetical protein